MANSPASPYVRPRELQDGLDRFIFHPLAARLARLLKPTGVSPNAVSLSGVLSVWAAAWCYTRLDWPLGWLAGFALHLLWHVIDGADGDLARLTGRQSATGELVDGLCDYAGHILLYVWLAEMGDDWVGGWSWLIASVAGASRLVQANFAESQRRSYLWWVYGILWIKHTRTQGDAVFRNRHWFMRSVSWLVQFYLDVAGWMAPGAARIDAAIDVSAHDPAHRRRIGRLARDDARRSLTYSKLLGANARTVLLGLCMGLGSPIYYFLVEAVLLNLVLAAALVCYNIDTRRLAAQISCLQES